MSKTHLTAITRKRLSTPMKYLHENGLIVGRALDYGCGKGYDCDTLGIDGYDPHYRPDTELRARSYDVITCNFVLNVIPQREKRENVLNAIWCLLRLGKDAYISVRNDRKNLNGFTKRGTWQGFIELDLPVVKKTSSFLMYRMHK